MNVYDIFFFFFFFFFFLCRKHESLYANRIFMYFCIKSCIGTQGEVHRTESSSVFLITLLLPEQKRWLALGSGLYTLHEKLVFLDGRFSSAKELQ